MRYSSSILVAIAVSFFTFLGMSLLISHPKFVKSTSIEMTSFSKVRDMKKIDTSKPTPPKTLPERKPIKQPPAMQKLDITQSVDRNTIQLPFNHTRIKGDDLSILDPPKVPGLGKDSLSRDSQLRQKFPISPRYPTTPLRNKIQGWVKVEFTVNELGFVTDAKVIDAKPKRVFDQATLKALRKSKFKPLIVDGKPRSQKAVQIIEFKIK